MNVEIKGLDKFINYIGATNNKIKGSLPIIVKKAAFLIQSTAKKEVTTGKNRAIDTGLMRSRINVISKGELQKIIRPETNYAIYVHEGTKKMKSRPFMYDSVDKVENEIKDLAGVEITRAIK